MSDLAGSPDASATPVYRLVGREPTGFGLGGRRLSPFVGREHELALLLDRLRQVASGRGHVIGILGEPGIGKSRLLFELRRRLGAEGVPCLEGRCLSHGTGVPYLPLVDLLRRAWDIDDSEAADGQVAVVRRRLETLGLDVERETPYLVRLLGLEVGTERLAALTPEGLKLGTFDALRQVMLATARGGRLVILVEDLHWIDRTSEEFLRALVDALPGGPILLVVTARPGYRPPWMDRSYASQIGLPPLSAAQSLEVVRSVLPDDATARRLAARGEGNPFFLEELAWAVAQDAAQDLAQIRIPDTIEATLAARINRLADGPRRLLETAAVLGREVPTAVLELVWEGSHLAEYLRALVGLEFLHAPGPALYAFKHALTQEVAYGRLAPSERERLHAAAGLAYETLYADRVHEVIDRLAYHFARTGEHGKAIEYLTRFADRASEDCALVDAVTALGEAMRHTDTLSDPDRRDRLRIDLVTRHCWPLTFLGRLRELLDLLLREQERVDRLGDPGLAAPYHWALAFTYDHLGDRRNTRPTALQALHEGLASGDARTVGLARWVLADDAFFTGRPTEGIQEAREAVRLLSATSERFFLGYANWILGVNAVAVGDLALAGEAAAETARIAGVSGDLRAGCHASWLAGWALALAGDTIGGVEKCDDAVRQAPDPVARAAALHFLGTTLVEAGRGQEAIAPLEEAAGLHSASGFSPLAGWDYAAQSEAIRMTGQADRALRVAEEARRSCEACEFPFAMALAQRALGRARLAEGDAAGALVELGWAREGFASIEARYELARTLLDLAGVAQALGHPDRAAHHLAEAHRLFTQLALPHWAGRTLQLTERLGVPLPPGDVRAAPA